MFEIYLIITIKVLTFLLMIFVASLVVALAKNLSAPQFNINSDGGFRRWSINSNLLNDFMKLVSKTGRNFKYSDLIVIFLLLSFSSIPLLVIPMDIGHKENDFVQILDSNYGCFISFCSIIFYYLLTFYLTQRSDIDTIQTIGIHRVKELISHLIIYLLMLAVIYQIYGSFDFEMINIQFDLYHYLALTPVIFVFCSTILSHLKKREQINNNTNLVIATFILSKRIFLISLISVFISLFVKEQIYIGQNEYFLFFLGFTTLLIKIFFIVFISNLLSGFKINKKVSRLFDYDLDFKILILLLNLIIIVLVKI